MDFSRQTDLIGVGWRSEGRSPCKDNVSSAPINLRVGARVRAGKNSARLNAVRLFGIKKSGGVTILRWIGIVLALSAARVLSHRNGDRNPLPALSRATNSARIKSAARLIVSLNGLLGHALNAGRNLFRNHIRVVRSRSSARHFANVDTTRVCRHDVLGLRSLRVIALSAKDIASTATGLRRWSALAGNVKCAAAKAISTFIIGMVLARRIRRTIPSIISWSRAANVIARFTRSTIASSMASSMFSGRFSRSWASTPWKSYRSLNFPIPTLNPAGVGSSNGIGALLRFEGVF